MSSLKFRIPVYLIPTKSSFDDMEDLIIEYISIQVLWTSVSVKNNTDHALIREDILRTLCLFAH